MEVFIMKEAFLEVQNDASDKACYNTFSYDPHSKVFGFMCVGIYDYFVSFMAFDSAEDWADLMGCEPQEFRFLEELNIGETTDCGDVTYTRIW